MLIQVKWTNGSYDYIKDFMLDCLLEAGVVDSFQRSSGWVKIGVDPVRSCTHNGRYNGPERRSMPHSSVT